jgi:acetylornithine deacetylase/succinyl-diaminopimelate desuccinylase-like protein
MTVEGKSGAADAGIGATDRRTLLGGAAAGVAAAMAPKALRAAEGDLAAVRRSIEKAHDANLKRIQDWIAHPSIAAENRNMEEGAQYMIELAKDAGFQTAVKVPTDGHPGVVATYDVGAPQTVGIYFMYDVKQFDPKEWSSPPLEARLIDKPGFGKVVMGRGAVNQKGPEATFLAALHAIRASGRKLPVNLVLVAEGEEEIGSPHFTQIVHQPNVLAAMKKCSGVIIPGAAQSANGSVTIDLGAKGIIECQLVASGEKWGRGPTHDVHSSLKAMVDSPVWRLVQALQTLVTPDGNTVAIDGWFENVRPLTAREKEIIAESAKRESEADLKKALGVTHWIDDLQWQQALERLASQPTVNIEGLVGGYTGPGGKTVLPHKATAKLDLRLVPNQTAKEALAKLNAHLKKRGFGDVEVIMTGGYDPNEVDENSSLIRAEQVVYKRAGVDVSLFPRSAGSWPGFVFTGAPLNLPAAHFGLGYGTGAHAPDEFYVIEASNPKVKGLDEAALGYADFLYQMAAAK